MHAVIEGGTETRLDAWGGFSDLPDLTGLEWMVDIWRDAGIASNGTPLSWSEIQAFCWVEHLPKSVARQVHAMSVAYCEGLRMTSPLSIPPMEMVEEST